MGKNIYLRKIFSKEEIEYTKRKLKEMADGVKSIDDMRDVISFLQVECESHEKDIHICKISYGWKLLFQANENLYECTWKAMTDYIRQAIDSGEWEMIDEYGDAYSLDDLNEDFEKLLSTDSYDRNGNPKRAISDSQLYKMAGNSIVVSCMDLIFENLFFPQRREGELF